VRVTTNKKIKIAEIVVIEKEKSTMAKLKVERADNCIWLIDDRENHQEVHLTPGQAKEFGQKLIDISSETQVPTGVTE